MKRRDFLEKWGLSSLKIKLGFLEGEFNPRDPDRAAAWELYVELLTADHDAILRRRRTGMRRPALQSVFAIFPLTREILRKHGSGAGEFAKLAIPVLNQIIRPFTAKWHRRSLAGAFKDPEGAAASSATNWRPSNRACAITPAPSPTWPRSRI